MTQEELNTLENIESYFASIEEGIMNFIDVFAENIYNKLNLTEKYIINNYENKTQKEIADELNISQCWVSNYITKAKNKIKDEYKNNY